MASSSSNDQVLGWEDVRHSWPAPRGPRNLNANKEAQQKRTVRIVRTYSKMTRAPTKDLQRLVVGQLQDALGAQSKRLDSSIGDRSSRDVQYMRMNSFMMNSREIVKFPCRALIDESRRIAKDMISMDEVEGVLAEVSLEAAFPAPIAQEIVFLMPGDESKIQRWEIGQICIDKQREEDTEQFQIFETEYLDPAVAARQSDEKFEKICSAYRAVVQKIVEVEYIEKNPETVEAVDKYMADIQHPDGKVTTDMLSGLVAQARRIAPAFVYNIMSGIMEELHRLHAAESFEPKDLEVTVGSSAEATDH